ncbi:hypothetical protein DKK77_07110 [Gilliamella apis]|nr:hypothetical protein DKK77_07110 [Gilliamella apis]
MIKFQINIYINLDLIFQIQYIVCLKIIKHNKHQDDQIPPKKADMIKLIITYLDGTFLNDQGDYDRDSTIALLCETPLMISKQ